MPAFGTHATWRARARECLGGPWDGQWRTPGIDRMNTLSGWYRAETHRWWGDILRYMPDPEWITPTAGAGS